MNGFYVKKRVVEIMSLKYDIWGKRVCLYQSKKLFLLSFHKIQMYLRLKKAFYLASLKILVESLQVWFCFHVYHIYCAICMCACPDFAELDVLLGQHIVLTLEQHFKPKI